MYSGPLFIASDHGGFQLKKRLVRYFENELNINFKDLGPAEFVEDDDYPDYAFRLTEQVLEKKARGILICKNGIGVCIAANKVAGIRAGIGYNTTVAKTMVQDDNTNVLCLAATTLSEEYALAIVKHWLSTDYSNESRHNRRLAKITEQTGL